MLCCTILRFFVRISCNKVVRLYHNDCCTESYFFHIYLLLLWRPPPNIPNGSSPPKNSAKISSAVRKWKLPKSCSKPPPPPETMSLELHIAHVIRDTNNIIYYIRLFGGVKERPDCTIGRVPTSKYNTMMIYILY